MGDRQPPSRLQNLCITIFYLIPTRQVRPFVPQPLKISEVAPGYTVGGLYAARYGKGSLGSMSEFGVLPAYVRYGDKKGFFMHHFCADHETPRGGAKNVWGIELGSAGFAWEMGEKWIGLELSSGGETVIKLKIKPIINEMPFSASFPFLCIKGNNVVFFKNQYASNIGLSSSKVTIPDESPLHGFPLGIKLLSTFWDASNIIVKEPEYVYETVLKGADKVFGSPIGKQM